MRLCHIWGYAVCLCPIKRTPCLYELEITITLNKISDNGINVIYICMKQTSCSEGIRRDYLKTFILDVYRKKIDINASYSCIVFINYLKSRVRRTRKL